ncbi:MAG: AbrB/MazE/SpoVT family DNA-binding domain-containing protein [Clostridia bacterium]
MKSTGIIRKVDELGRIVIPKEIRDNLDIAEGNGLQIYVDGNKVILKKDVSNCLLCENEKNLKEFCGKYVCKKCINQIKAIK